MPQKEASCACCALELARSLKFRWGMGATIAGCAASRMRGGFSRLQLDPHQRKTHYTPKSTATAADQQLQRLMECPVWLLPPLSGSLGAKKRGERAIEFAPSALHPLQPLLPGARWLVSLTFPAQSYHGKAGILRSCLGQTARASDSDERREARPRSGKQVSS